MGATTVFAAFVGLFAMSLGAPVVPASTNSTDARQSLREFIPYEPVGGWCGVYLHLFIGQRGLEVFTHVHDGAQVPMGGDYYHNVGERTGLPIDLEYAIGPISEAASFPARFQYGDQVWESGAAGTYNGRCSVSKWNTTFTKFTETYQTDINCGFTC
ncbi:uncharacterized protein PG998_008732 [Apiospora kogelbergensis]|uniref:uncharacterized protein n=1 Tax=Apiospora kogelbergensis TaxID=1337665 RepID=UPI003131566D